MENKRRVRATITLSAAACELYTKSTLDKIQIYVNERDSNTQILNNITDITYTNRIAHTERSNHFTQYQCCGCEFRRINRIEIVLWNRNKRKTL